MRNEPAVVLDADFSPKLKSYYMLTHTLGLICTIAGILLLPIWVFLGPWWISRYCASLSCVLTERTVVVRKGILFRSEVTIPLNRIQDISLRDGPILRSLGLMRLRIETAGQSTSATGASEADLVGLVDARGARNRILAQRDLLVEQEDPAGTSPRHHRDVLEEIRDTLQRIERMAAERESSSSM